MTYIEWLWPLHINCCGRRGTSQLICIPCMPHSLWQSSFAPQSLWFYRKQDSWLTQEILSPKAKLVQEPTFYCFCHYIYLMEVLGGVFLVMEYSTCLSHVIDLITWIIRLYWCEWKNGSTWTSGTNSLSLWLWLDDEADLELKMPQHFILSRSPR